jgi:hypothetical protein
MVVVRLVGRKPISVGRGNPECPLHDAHEERIYEVNGKTVRVYVNGESASQYLNEFGINKGAPVLDYGKRSRIVIITPDRAYGAWINIDQNGFAQCHLWLICEEPLDSEELYLLIRKLEDEFYKEIIELQETEEELRREQE